MARSHNGRCVVVARFKRGQSGAGTFMTHLRKHWTVEAYLARHNANEAPLDIVKTTGYLLPHIKKELKRNGYPLTNAGLQQYLADTATARWAKYEEVRARRNQPSQPMVLIVQSK
jgi:hypothetical protein